MTPCTYRYAIHVLPIAKHADNSCDWNYTEIEIVIYSGNGTVINILSHSLYLILYHRHSMHSVLNLSRYV